MSTVITLKPIGISISKAFNMEAGNMTIEGYEPNDHPLVRTDAIKPDYVFRRENLRDVLDFIDENYDDGLWLNGATGCGKTSIIEQIAFRLNYPCYSHTCGAGDRFETFVGRWDLVQGQTVWIDGILTKAMKEGAILLLNEMDFLLPEEFGQFNGILEGAALIIDQLGGEVVRPHRKFRLIATGNSNGGSDSTGLYAGVNAQNLASMDRFVVINCEYSQPDVEFKILDAAVPQLPEEIKVNMIRVANAVRNLFEGKVISDTGVVDHVDADSELSITFSTRTLLRWGRKTVRMHNPNNPAPLKYALERSLLNRCRDQSEREAIETIATAIFGELYDPQN